MKNRWLDAVIELQGIAQAGLYYAKDVYDKERYQRLRDISAELMSMLADRPIEQVRDAFCDDVGYLTPKIDTRAVIVRDNRILLVRERSGGWSLPGGWCDAGLSVAENTVKEALEETGLTVTAEGVIAVQDRERHNEPAYIYKIIKIFVRCSEYGGEFVPNSDTSERGWFAEDALPELDIARVSGEQLHMCFEACRQGDAWKTQLD